MLTSRCRPCPAWAGSGLLATAILTAASMLAPWTGAAADEGGVAFWLSGQYASLAAAPSSPGWSLPTQIYYYRGSADSSTTFSPGETLTAGLTSSDSPLLFLEPTYAPYTPVFGAQAALGIGLGYARNIAQVDVAVSQQGIEQNRGDSVWGGTDLTPIASVAWSRGVHNWMTYLTGNVPLGSYDSQRLANIGIGHAAIDAGAGYTYLNPRSGREFSAVAGLTYNWENPSTQYQNGIDSHLDWGVSQFRPANWQVGLAGYVYCQLTGDSGSGDDVGAFKSAVAAVGPQVGYSFKAGGQQWYMNVRGYWEFWAQNRTEGYALFVTLNIPIGNVTQ